MGDIRTRKINQKHLNDIKMEGKIIYFMCLLMDLSILYEITEIYCIILRSLPSWERGLKFVFIVVTVVGISRSLRGSMVANAVQNQTGIMPKAR